MVDHLHCMLKTWVQIKALAMGQLRKIIYPSTFICFGYGCVGCGNHYSDIIANVKLSHIAYPWQSAWEYGTLCCRRLKDKVSNKSSLLLWKEDYKTSVLILIIIFYLHIIILTDHMEIHSLHL